MGEVITDALLQPIVADISSVLQTILPIGLTIMGTMIGVKLIPGIIYRFL